MIVSVHDTLDELIEIVEDLYLSNVTTDEEDVAFEELVQQIRLRYPEAPPP